MQKWRKRSSSKMLFYLGPKKSWNFLPSLGENKAGRQRHPQEGLSCSNVTGVGIHSPSRGIGICEMKWRAENRRLAQEDSLILQVWLPFPALRHRGLWAVSVRDPNIPCPHSAGQGWGNPQLPQTTQKGPQGGPAESQAAICTTAHNSEPRLAC